MLLRFSVQNYLSFKTVQTLELIANARHKESLDLNAFKTECSLFPRVLKTAAILGPNASGKSNLLKALQTLRALVIRKEVAGPNPMALVKPFHFVENEQQEPVSFDVQLLLDGIPSNQIQETDVKIEDKSAGMMLPGVDTDDLR